MAITNATQRVAQQALEELFDHHIEAALRSVLPFTRNEPGPFQLDVAGTRVPIDRISAAVRREIAPLIDGAPMAREVELMIRAMGIKP
jgi:hypothetical protein